jgi:beta-lactamase class A
MSTHLNLKQTKLYSKLYFPLDGYLGTTTPKEYVQLFKLFYEKRIGNEATHNEFFTILKKQHYNTMLTRSIAPGLRASEDADGNPLFQVASKSGSLDQCRNDGGIFFTPRGDYLVCIFTKDFGDEHYHDQHEAYQYGSRISRLIFDHFLTTGSLAD